MSLHRRPRASSNSSNSNAGSGSIGSSSSGSSAVRPIIPSTDSISSMIPQRLSVSSNSNFSNTISPPISPNITPIISQPNSNSLYQSSDSHLRDLLIQFSRFTLIEALAFNPLNPTLPDYIRFLRNFHSLPILSSSSNSTLADQKQSFELAIRRVKLFIRQELEKKSLLESEKEFIIQLLENKKENLIFNTNPLLSEGNNQQQGELDEGEQGENMNYNNININNNINNEYLLLSNSSLLSRLSDDSNQFNGFSSSDWEEITKEEQNEAIIKLSGSIAKPIQKSKSPFNSQKKISSDGKDNKPLLSRPFSLSDATSIAAPGAISHSGNHAPSSDSIWTILLNLHHSFTQSSMILLISNKLLLPIIPVAYTILLFMIIGLYTLFGLFGLFHIFAFLYPAYWTFLTLEVVELNENNNEIPEPADLLSLREWLIYWSIYGLYYIIEPIGDYIFMNIISLKYYYYYILKFIFFLYCFIPPYYGTHLVYEYCIQPLYYKYENYIELYMDIIYNELNYIIINCKRLIINKLAYMISGGNSNATPRWGNNNNINMNNNGNKNNKIVKLNPIKEK